MPRRALNVPANETPAAKFVRLANQRTNRILENLKQLGSLGGSAYQSTGEQVKKINEALEAGLKRAVEQLNKKQTTTQEFKL